MTGHALESRTLGKSGPAAGLMGMGCWAIGGPFYSGHGCRYPTGAPLGYGEVDDSESIRAIHSALDAGITFFDTADAYGTGHSEQVLGNALRGKRSRVLLATKFGNTYDASTKQLTGINVSRSYIRKACEASLSRLQADWIDLYQLHVGDLPIDQANEVADTLDELCKAGLIRFYAWSTDDPERAEALADRPNCTAVQFDMNVFEDAPSLLGVARRHDLASVIRLPLAMGFLTGKFTTSSRLSSIDIRSRPPHWLRYFEEGGRASAVWLKKLDALREILTSEGRTLAQGALAWVWARDDRTIPIPGIRTEAQAKENAAAMQFGPLTPCQMREIDRVLDRTL
jgi:aryl-alcohol dehydrogenase-like predicted oxidoreductase